MDGLSRREIQDGFEQDQTVVPSQNRLGPPFRMGHHSKNVTRGVADPRNGLRRAIRIVLLRDLPFGRAIAENDLVAPLHFRERSRIDIIVSIGVSDRKTDDLSFLIEPSIGKTWVLHSEENLFADELQASVSHQSTGEKARLDQDLEPVADSENQSSRGREPLHGLHDGRKTGQSAGPQIVSIRKSTGDDDHIDPGELLLFVPDEPGARAQHAIEHMVTIVVTIRAREDKYTNVHDITLNLRFSTALSPP
jgi:hypothetical protein